MKRGILVFVLLGAGLAIHAQGLSDLSVQLRPAVELPIGSKSLLFSSDAVYGLGGSVAVKGQYIFPGLPLLYSEGVLNVALQPTQADLLSLISAGLGAGVNLRLGDTMSFQLGGEAGWYVGMYPGTDPASNPYWGGGLSLAWDFSPTFSLSAGAGYRYYLGYDSTAAAYTDLYQGVSVNLGTVFRLFAGRDRSKLKVKDIHFDPVFPVFYSYYDDHPVGSIELVNGENSSITDLNVYFHVKQYMEQPKLSATVPRLRRGDAASVDLRALFTNSLLFLTEGTKVSSEIIAEYTYLGRKFTQRIPYTLRIYDRNSMTWDDDRKAASFVSAKDPTVLLFSKNTAGIIREQGYSPIDFNLRAAMGIFEALRLYGMNYVIDPQSSYIEASKDAAFIDFLQFPSQTLVYRSGDCDDLSILYCSMLESVGIETAFITVPGHIYMAFALDLSPEEAKQTFTNTDDLIFVGDRVWVPVEITMVNDGFSKAWKAGAKQWREALGKNSGAFYPVHEAWKDFQPVGISSTPLSLVYPGKESILERYQQALEEFVDREIGAAIGSYQAQFREGKDSPRLRNRFGVLYARYGRFADAEQQFLKAVDLSRSYAAPMVNLGNVYYLQQEPQKALRWYERARELAPNSKAVLAGLAQVQYELEQYDKVRESYSHLAEVAPEVAERYAYLVNENDALGRASRAGEGVAALWEVEEGE